MTRSDGEWSACQDALLHDFGAKLGADTGATAPGPRSGASMVTVTGHETRSVVLRELLHRRTLSAAQLPTGWTWADVASTSDGFVDSEGGLSDLHPALGSDPRERRWQRTGPDEVTAFLEPARQTRRETLAAGFSEAVWMLNDTVAAAVAYNTTSENATATVLELKLEAVAGTSRGPGMGALVRARGCRGG